MPGTTTPHLNIWLMGLGYFAFYTPYSALTKATTQGLLPGAGPVSGFVILPVTVIASVVCMLVFLSLLGWWRYAGKVHLMGMSVPFPRRVTFISGCCDAVIIATTTLAYSFSGISIVFALLLMRGGVLVIAPIIDRLSGCNIHLSHWLALGLALSALVVAFSEQGGYALTVVAAVDIAAYWTGYFFRFRLMSRHAKSADPLVNRRFFVEEQMVATPVLLLILGIAALIGHGELMQGIRQGFTEYLFSGEALWAALLIGLLYQGLGMFGSLVYLDHRSHSFSVPVNRCASIFAGIIAAALLTSVLGNQPTSPYQLAGAGLLVAALCMLAAPSLMRAHHHRLLRNARGLYLFVCNGNTIRSPVAQALCTAELAQRIGIDPARIARVAVSAGLQPRLGEDLHHQARDALVGLGIGSPDHQARSLSSDLIDNARAVVCMTPRQRDELLDLYPAAAGKLHCLDPSGELAEPGDTDSKQWTAWARSMQDRVAALFDQHLPLPVPIPASVPAVSRA